MKGTHYEKSAVDVISILEKNEDNHMAVVFNDKQYCTFKDSMNTELCKLSNIRAVNKYGKQCDFLFIHCLSLRFDEILRLERAVAVKIIWVCWGHDLYRPFSKIPHPDGFIRRIKRKIKLLLLPLIGRKINSFCGIGIGFKYDALEIRKRFPDVSIYKLPYGYLKFYQEDKLRELLEPLNGLNKLNNEKPIKIMIGHSAYPFVNHIYLMKKILKFKDENIIISMPLSYGDKIYAKEVADFAVSNFGKKCEIITEYMSFPEYYKYLNSIDIAILDNAHQSALGNLFMLLQLHKKIFINRAGIIKYAMDFECIKTFCTDEIGSMSFEEFISPPASNFEMWDFFVKQNIDDDYLVKAWKNSINEIKAASRR